MKLFQATLTMSAAALILTATSVFADQKSDCLLRDPKIVIPACSALIDGKTVTDKNELATYFASRARSYYNSGDRPHAETDTQKAIDLNPKNAIANLLQGALAFEKQDYVTALGKLTNSIESDPNYARAYVNRAKVYAAMEDAAKAKADFDKAISVDPKDATLYFSRSDGIAKGEKLELALPDLDKAIEINQNMPEPLHSRALIYIDSNDYEKALIDLNKAVALNGTDAKILLDRGLAHEKLNLIPKTR